MHQKSSRSILLPSSTLFSSSPLSDQIFMWNFKDNKDLVGVAFIDAEIYVHTASAVKNFVLTGDITHSIQLLRYQVSPM